MPKISVIVPVYNGEKTIKRCLGSITSQTLSDIEIIAVNDGSADNTLSLLNEITDSRIKIITTENGGQGFARNRGIDEARGEYLAFVDADDTIEKDMLEIMYTAAKKENADVVQCNLFDIYEDGTKRIQLAMPDETIEITDRARYTDKYFTPCCHSFEVCNKLIKKSVLGDLRFKDTRKYFSEDLLFNLGLISKISRITFVNKPLYNYYQHDASHMHSDSEKRLEALQLLFRDYLASAGGEMRRAVSYTAAMVLSYSSGICARTETARKMYAGAEFKDYIRAALKCRCRAKHRVFLIAMRLLGTKGKAKLCEIYSGRQS